MPQVPFARRLRTLLAILALLVLVVACTREAGPRLSVSATDVTVSVTSSASIVVRNVGTSDSVLEFEVWTDEPWLRVSRASGTLIAGGPTEAVSVTISLETGTIPDVGSVGAVLITSNGGEALVEVTVGMPVGYTTCLRDTYTTTALQRSRASALAPAPPSVVEAEWPAGVNDASPINDEYLVFYWPDARGLASVRAEAVRRADPHGSSTVLRRGSGSEHDLLRIPEHARERVIDNLRAQPGVRFIVPNLTFSRSYVPNDPFVDDQWWASCFGVHEAWAIQRGSAPAESVVLAIIDDGFNVNHLDLNDKTLPGFDFSDFDANVTTSSGHGTHVAGIALASGDNATGIAGIAFGDAVDLLPIKVFPETGNASTDAVINGMRWAVGLHVTGAPDNQNPADVVNLSLGVAYLPSNSTVMDFAAALEVTVAEMRSRGAVVVAAAGNSATNTDVEFPARTPGVIAVGAVDWSGVRSSFSAVGEHLDVMAPGGAEPPDASICQGRGLLSLWVPATTSLNCQRGTSMAAPFVSGALALLIANDPDTYRGDPAAIEAHLKATALFTDGMNEHEYGAGIACPDALLGAPTRCGWETE